MISMKRSFLFSLMTLLSLSALARDTYIFFSYSPGTPKSQRHGYTVESGGERQGMYGVYSPGKTHLTRDVMDSYKCPLNLVKVHWVSSMYQSYQDFFVTRDDKPSLKARFRWYKPYAGKAYITVFSNPDHMISYNKDFIMNCTHHGVSSMIWKNSTEIYVK